MITLNSYIFWWRCRAGTIGRLEFTKRDGIPNTQLQLFFAKKAHEELKCCNCQNQILAIHGNYPTIKNMEWPEAVIYIPPNN